MSPGHRTGRARPARARTGWRLVQAGAAIVGALALAACGEETPTEPASPFSGTWELVAVDGAPPPRVVQVLQLSPDVRYLAAARLEVRTRGRVDDIRSFYWERPDGSRYDAVEDTVTVPYDVAGDSVTLRRFALSGDDWTDGGRIATNDLGTVLSLRVRYQDDRPFGPPEEATFRYRRVP